MPSRTGPPTVTGRWSLLPERDPDSTRRLHAVAQALLDRHGIVTRGSVVAERVPGGFGAVYPVLRAMEEAGQCRRGYFVEGLGAAQFALPGAVDRMRAMAATQAPIPGLSPSPGPPEISSGPPGSPESSSGAADIGVSPPSSPGLDQGVPGPPSALEQAEGPEGTPGWPTIPGNSPSGPGRHEAVPGQPSTPEQAEGAGGTPGWPTTPGNSPSGPGRHEPVPGQPSTPEQAEGAGGTPGWPTTPGNSPSGPGRHEPVPGQPSTPEQAEGAGGTPGWPTTPGNSPSGPGRHEPVPGQPSTPEQAEGAGGTPGWPNAPGSPPSGPAFGGRAPGWPGSLEGPAGGFAPDAGRGRAWPGAPEPTDPAEPEAPPITVLAAADPANPFGAALAWPPRPGEVPGGHRPGRKAGALVVLSGGHLVLYVERGGKTLLSWTSDPAVLVPAASGLAAAVRGGALGRLTVERADGTGVYDTPLAQALADAGFRPTPRGLRLRG